MATNPSTLPENAGRITAPSTEYPRGSAQNDSTGTTGNGTPIRSSYMNDIYGMQQALLRAASLVPTGNADTAIFSQYLQAMNGLVMGLANTYTDTGSANAYVLALRTGQQIAPALTDGAVLRFRAANASTDASTVDVSLVLGQAAGTTVLPIVRDGSTPNIATTDIVEIEYRASVPNFEQTAGLPSGFFQNASNLNAGTVNIARLPVTATATDATAQRLLKVGDFGNGAAVVLNNQDMLAAAFPQGHFYAFTNPINPPPVPDTVGWFTSRYGVGTSTTSAFVVARGASHGRVFTNIRSGADPWQGWTETLTERILTKASSAQVTAGTSDATYITPLALKDAGVTDAVLTQFGVDQAWQDLTASRAVNTTYTNTTGKPIMVAVRRINQSNAVGALQVDGVNVSDQGQSSNDQPTSLSAVVPDGSEYVFSTNGTLAIWRELR